jgi:uncharacterized protein (TIGR03118 family)
LLVGNFGDGTINAYDSTTGAFIGALDDTNGNPISITGLWGLDFGNGAHSQGSNSLFFTAGIAGPDNVEDHGLFGDLSPVPEPSALLLTGFGLAAVMAGGFRRFMKFRVQ